MNKELFNKKQCVKYLLFAVMVLNCGCEQTDNKKKFTDTSKVDYSIRQNIKLLQIEKVENEYLNRIAVKVSINKPIQVPNRIMISDSISIKNYVDSIVNGFELKRRTHVVIYAFNETSYTNKVLKDKKGLLFCEYTPCISNYGYVINDEQNSK
jgi:hypothetical protein